MQLARLSTSPAIRATVPRMAGSVRMYTEGPNNSAGATAQSQGWHKREKVRGARTLGAGRLD